MEGVEAAGGLVTGGLIAKLLSRRKSRQEAALEEHPGVCSDCGAPVIGRYCSDCGQPTHVHRSLLHLGEEILHGVMHFDARIWRTLPLLVLNPGRLTREWIAGKRTRYVSPLALFLFTVFLMFFVLSFSGGLEIEQRPLEERMADARLAMAASEAELAQARASAARPDSQPGAEGVVIGATAAAEAARASLQALEQARTSGPRADGLAPGSWQAQMADAVKDGRVRVGLGDKTYQEKILHKLSNPDFAFYKVQQTIYKFAFLLVPLSIPFVWLLFAWKRGFTWYDHGVFVLYSLTFVSILAMVESVLGRLGGIGSGVGMLLASAIPIHMFAQLKGTYALGWFSALWRTFALMIFCALVLVLFILVVVMLGLGA